MKIRELRKERGLTQAQLADAIGVTTASVSAWEKEKSVPRKKQMMQIADFFGIDVDQIEIPSKPQPRKIPVLGHVPAGVPLEAIETIIDYEEIPDDSMHEYFGLRVYGDSMSPKYIDGDTIIVRVQNTCTDGQDCVVRVNGFDATLKTVRILPDGIELHSVNPKYAPMRFADVQIIGVVAELRRKFIPL